METNKTCCCCGNEAGRWKQHYNRDTGYGICRCCLDWMIAKGSITAQEIESYYGKAGINYEAAHAEKGKGQ